MNPYVVLQSGFLAPKNPLMVPSDQISAQTINQELKLGLPVKETLSPFHYHNELNDLFRAHDRNPELLHQFDFRERLFQNVKDAMGVSSFYAWCAAQHNSPHLTKTHIQFMEDTLQYLETGRRSVEIASWLTVVNAKRAPNVDAKTLLAPEGYFETHVLAPFQRRNADLITLSLAIVRWCTYPNGTADLLYFSKIVFGETYARTVI